MPFGEAFPSTLEAARLGADWAWRALYRDLAPSILAYVRARGAAEPDDLLGEVFLQVVRKLSQFHGGEAQFRAWTFTIAHRRVIDDVRWRARRPVQAAAHEAIEAAGPRGNNEEESLSNIATECVRAVIDKLSSDQRDVLLLRIVAGLTVAEVAQAVGKRPGAIKGLQARGLAAIKREMSEQGVTLAASMTFT